MHLEETGWVWTGFITLRIGPGCGFLWTQYWTFRFISMEWVSLSKYSLLLLHIYYIKISQWPKQWFHGEAGSCSGLTIHANWSSMAEIYTWFTKLQLAVSITSQLHLHLQKSGHQATHTHDGLTSYRYHSEFHCGFNDLRQTSVLYVVFPNFIST
jgi:hypothetical protein